MQSGNSIAGRGKRKRAVDFFKVQLPTAYVEQPKATGGAEVLEKAYHAAMALATVPISSNERSTPEEESSITDASDVRRQIQMSKSRESVPETESSRKDIASSISGLSTTAPGQDGMGELADFVEGGEGARAVDAEGLIWLDNTQRTAYSVRYGRN